MDPKKPDARPVSACSDAPASKVNFVQRPLDGRGVVIGTDHMHTMKRMPKPKTENSSK